MSISPNDGLARQHSIWLELMARNYKGVIQAADAIGKGIDTSWAEYLTVIAHVQLGELVTGEKMIEAAARKYPGHVLFHSSRAIVAALKADEESAQRAIERTIQNRKPYGHFHHAQFDIACALAVLGRNDEAIGWLSDAVHGGFPCLLAVENDPLLASLREESAYRDLVAELVQSRNHFASVFEGLRKKLTSAS